MQILISSPSDLPQEHRDTIARTIRRWNNQHSRFYGIHYSPTDSSEGGAPLFGEYAQDVVNKQIVDDSDMVLAIFTDRLGTPTPDHKSGTAEEIERALSQKKEVAVLQNDCHRAPQRSTEAMKQAEALGSFITSIRPRAFISSYESGGRLAEIVEQLLSTLARKFRTESDAGLKTDDAGILANAGLVASSADDEIERGIWPRIEVNAGNKKWKLVLESNLRYSAKNVSVKYVDSDGGLEELFDLMSHRYKPIASLPPNGKMEFPILQAAQSPSMAQCVVDWEDPDGEGHTTVSTVRTH
ncbi:DUF4062 domain-containing protein [Mycolicibacterium fluoranthenivorans]|uniref:DUF4062 domain-containing protein n=1 Tax=Mycolicibacterium fluoranthenivorans TaxID=258505 RepID=A0A7G8PKH4_9MYCO|nr:DUF4062 domain-containing protein [Mycolicibacterium fluoranthenivorans]QNJ94840.1 DUF4062 domain-containing protein [Mycolicibacterium fluoranthenivorans]